MKELRQTDQNFLADAAAQAWANVLIRATWSCPANIDAILVPANPLARAKKGRVRFHSIEALPMARTIGPQERPVVGVLCDDELTGKPVRQLSALAARLAALAIEKQCDIVVFSHQDNAGLERFGFRVERIAGHTKAEQAACLAQLRRFWGIDIMI